MRGCVLPAGAPGSWDAAGAAKPFVKRFASEAGERWKMWYAGADDAAARAAEDPVWEELSKGLRGGTVGVAVSRNGLVWERGSSAENVNPVLGTDGPREVVGRVLARNEGEWWAFDCAHVLPGCVEVFADERVDSGSGNFWMYYSGADFEKRPAVAARSLSAASQALDEMGRAEGAADERGLRSRVGLAISQDGGMSWARIEGAHHTKAAFCPTERPEGAWDADSNAAPSVVFHSKGDVRMYYHAFDRDVPGGGAFAIGMARSQDGMSWARDAPGCGRKLGAGEAGAFDTRGAAYPHVVPNPAADDGSYLMFYEARDEGHAASIGVAWSPDGLNWRPASAPVLKGAGGDAWDADGVGMPCFVHVPGGTSRLYYTGWAADGIPSIGAADVVGIGQEGQLELVRVDAAALTKL